MKNRLFLAVITAVGVSVSPSAGEDGDRPSRTASDGSQVIDYVAELESDVDSLKRQVTALENELSHKNDLLEQSAGGGRRPIIDDRDRSAELSKELSDARQRLAEQSDRLQAQYARLAEQGKKISELTAVVESQKSLTTHHEARERDLKEQLEERARGSEAKLRQVEADKGALAARLSESSTREKELQMKIAQLEERAKIFQVNEIKLRQIEEEKGALVLRLAEHSNREKELQDKMATLEAAVSTDQGRSGQLAQVQESERRLIKAQADLNTIIASQKNLLSQRESYAKELEQRVKQQAEALELQRAKLEESDLQKGARDVRLVTASALEQNKEDVQRAALSSPSVDQGVRARQGEQVVSIAPLIPQNGQTQATKPVVQSSGGSPNTIASRVRGELNAVRAQFGERDRLFAEYATTSPALRIKPARAVSRRGETLSDLETALRNATNAGEAARIKQSLEEIKRALDEDIKLIQRLNRK